MLGLFFLFGMLLFQNDARVTEGMVLTKRISHSSKDSTSYWVSYRFSASDEARDRDAAHR